MGLGRTTGDFIVRADGQPVWSVVDLLKLIKQGNGKPMTLTYVRDGKSHTATLKELPKHDESVSAYLLRGWRSDSRQFLIR